MPIVERTFITKKGKQTNASFYKVTISDPASKAIVSGQMKSGFAFQLQAKWADLFTGLVPGAELLQKTGDASLTTGLFSQKYYQGGSNLQMPVEFRVWEHEESETGGFGGGNKVLNASKALSYLMVPNSFSKGAIVNAIDKSADLAGGVVSDVVDVGADEKKITEAGSSVYNRLEKFASGSRTLTLTIGNFFTCRGMVIESLDVTYSKELTHTGPLYGDFKVNLLSLQSLTRNGGTYGVDTIFTNPTTNITINGQSLSTPASDIPPDFKPTDLK